MGRASACDPGPELVRVAYDPDVADVIVCDFKGEDADGGAVPLGDQAGLAVDGSLEDGQVRRVDGQVGQVAGDLLAAFDGVQGGGGVRPTIRAISVKG
jgi:hypothetical protein